MILRFQTDRPWQTVQTQIRLLLENWFDQGLHFLLFHFSILKETEDLCLNFKLIAAIIFGVLRLTIFTVS